MIKDGDGGSIALCGRGVLIAASLAMAALSACRQTPPTNLSCAGISDCPTGYACCGDGVVGTCFAGSTCPAGQVEMCGTAVGSGGGCPSGQTCLPGLSASGTSGGVCGNCIGNDCPNGGTCCGYASAGTCVTGTLCPSGQMQLCGTAVYTSGACPAGQICLPYGVSEVSGGVCLPNCSGLDCSAPDGGTASTIQDSGVNAGLDSAADVGAVNASVDAAEGDGAAGVKPPPPPPTVDATEGDGAGCPSLVVNGDFALGNVDFSTDYTYVAPPSLINAEGEYTVWPDPESGQRVGRLAGDERSDRWPRQHADRQRVTERERLDVDADNSRAAPNNVYLVILDGLPRGGLHITADPSSIRKLSRRRQLAYRRIPGGHMEEIHSHVVVGFEHDGGHQNSRHESHRRDKRSGRRRHLLWYL